MNESCEVCGLRYEKEPGTFYGAMYVSYGFSVAMVVILFVATLVLGNDPPLWAYFTIIIPTLILSTPIFFRYSRMIWLYFFSDVHYNPKYEEK